MFIDRVITTREEVELVAEETGLFDDPPPGLRAAIAWEEGDGVTVVTVWDTPGARGDFAAERIMPLVGDGRVRSKPDVLAPHRVFVRS